MFKHSTTGSIWQAAAIAAAMAAAGCEARAHVRFDEIDVVDAHGYRHHGYYDDRHDWHGGYYDEGHAFHEDPHDWHQE